MRRNKLKPRKEIGKFKKKNDSSNKIHGHLNFFLLETTFLVEHLVVNAAIKNYLIAPGRTSMICKEVDEILPQIPPTSTGIHNNILNMPNLATVSQKFLLNEDTPRCNDLSRELVFNNADNMVISNGIKLSKSILEFLVGDGITNAELSQQLYETFALVRDL